jgi:hypothetical protein
LAFPTIPEELAVKLKKQDEWLFSTRKLEISPYDLKYYVDESDSAPVGDYAVLCHSGHGANSYAIQYYLVRGPLRMFLHIGYGSVYMNANRAVAMVGECFSLADRIVQAAKASRKLAAGDRLTIVGSDFYGSYWSAPGGERQPGWLPLVLAEVIEWLKNPPSDELLQQTGPP